MIDRILLALGVLGLFAIAIALMLIPAPSTVTVEPVRQIEVLTSVPPTITILDNERFMVTNVNPRSGQQGHYVVISLASGEPQVVAEGNWRPLLRK